MAIPTDHFDNEQMTIYKTLLELLHSIKQGDASTYSRLTSSTLSCIEPETGGQLVLGLDFHLFLVEKTSKATKYHIEIVDPVIRVYGNTAYAAYILTNSFWNDNGPRFSQVQETRIFHKENDLWKMVHFHRSAIVSHQ